MTAKTRKQFPLLQQYTYANTAASGLLSESLMEWRQEHDLDYLIKGSLFTMKSNEMLAKTRATVGNFFSCPGDNVVLVPNFTIGLNLMLEGLDTSEKVLLLKGDYPSLNRPFESRGFAVSYTGIDQNLEDKIYEAVKTNGITILALSIVQWLHGIKIDLDFLTRLKSDFPHLMIIADGTQFLGTSNFDFSNAPIDVIGASAYKWLLAGYGNGFVMVQEAAKERFRLKSHGYGSGRNTNDLIHMRTFGKQLEPGHLDSLNFGSLAFSLEYLKDLGMDTIANEMKLLSEYAKAQFMELGLLDDSVVFRETHSTIFNIKGDTSIYNKLVDDHILCSQRGEGIRLSFHFYNTVADIDRIINVLKK